MTIRLHIERVVIDQAAAEGIRPETLHDALAAELGRLLSEPGSAPLGPSAEVPRARASLPGHPGGLAPALAGALHGCVSAASGGGRR